MGKRHDVVWHGRLADYPGRSTITAEGFRAKTTEALGDCTASAQSFSHNSPLALQVTVEVFVRTECFEINELDPVIPGVTEEPELALASEFVDPQVREIALFLFANIRVVSDSEHCLVNVRHDIIM